MQVSSNTLIVFIAPNRLCDYETLLHQNVLQHAVFPVAYVPVIIPLRATVDTRRLPTPGLDPEYKTAAFFQMHFQENNIVLYSIRSIRYYVFICIS